MRPLRAVVLSAAVAAVTITAVPLFSPASAAAGADTIKGDRATVRDAPARLVLANARNGDPVEVQAYCGEWVRINVDPPHVMSTPIGWVLRSHLTRASQSGGLDGVPERCGSDTTRWRDWVGAINAPFRSLRKVDGLWRRITFGTGVNLLQTPECVPSLNYTRRSSAPDVVDPAQRVPGLDTSKVSFRYVTTDGSIALVSAPPPGADYGVWSFVPSSCLQPKNREHVYFDEPVVQLEDLSGLHGGTGYPDSTIRSRGCSAALLSPTRPRFGYWPDPEPANRPPCPV
ncbi:MAG TPA: hypothetical protein VH969_21210 [Actinophytocola sp.]|uniref:hypothetical protein n=1 Tax=Actinophytocola sp. TaxID=1872138 RepID=UPI002F938293